MTLTKLVIPLALAAAAIPAQAASEFAGPALAAICADGVTPNPIKPGYWHLDYPHFAIEGDTLVGTMYLRPNAQGAYALVKVDRANPETFTEIARFEEPIRDVKIHDSKIWALFSDRFVALEMATSQKVTEVRTLAAEDKDSTAQAFAWAGDKLVIAHGHAGMVVYDGAARGITMRHTLNLSENGFAKATDVVALSSGQVAFAVENLTVRNEPPFPFEGVIVMNLQGRDFLQKFAYDRRTAGSIALPRLIVSGGELVVNNWGTLHRIDIEAMKASGRPSPRWVPVKFETPVGVQAGELLGDLVVDGGELLACGHVSYMDRQTNKVIHTGVLYRGQP